MGRKQFYDASEAKQNEIIDGQGFGVTVTPSDTPIGGVEDELDGHPGTSYLTLKEFFIGAVGMYRVRFDYASEEEGIQIWMRIYKNDVALGTERTTTSVAFTDYTQDLNFAAGDLCQVKGKGPGTKEARNRDLYFYGEVARAVLTRTG